MTSKRSRLIAVVLWVAASAALWAEEIPAAPAVGRLYAVPLGDVSLQVNRYSTITPGFVLNNDGDRIGVHVKLCKDLSDDPCKTLTFVYPQLHLDRAKKLVYMGETPVATFRSWGSRLTATKEYRLGTEIVSDRYDTGFDRHPRETLRVFLEHR